MPFCCGSGGAGCVPHTFRASAIAASFDLRQ
jgi:hypothetical protein